MIETSITITSESELALVVAKLASLISKPCVILLKGDLGAGKTTFVKAFLKTHGVADQVSSPTYSVVNEYQLADGKAYHIDLYRLNDTEEALDIGIEEYLDSGYFCLVEWPQIIEPLVENPLYIEITVDGNERCFAFRQEA